MSTQQREGDLVPHGKQTFTATLAQIRVFTGSEEAKSEHAEQERELAASLVELGVLPEGTERAWFTGMSVDYSNTDVVEQSGEVTFVSRATE